MAVPVIVCVIMPVRAAVTVGTALRIEGSLHWVQPSAEPFHHVLYNVIAPDPEGRAHELRRQMPVAQMPGDPDEMGRVLGLDLDKVFRFGHHFDNPPVLQLKTIGVAQVNGARFVQQKGQTFFSAQDGPPAIAVIEIERDPVCRLPLPASGGVNFLDTYHYVASTFAFIALKAGRSRRRLK